MTRREQVVLFFSAMADRGFTYEEADALRRTERRLHSWAERMCNEDILIDATGKASVRYAGSEKRYPIRNMERGALRRVESIVASRNARHLSCSPAKCAAPVEFYHQTDPRGCALYLLSAQEIAQWLKDAIAYQQAQAKRDPNPQRVRNWPSREQVIASHYNQGFAVMVSR